MSVVAAVVLSVTGTMASGEKPWIPEKGFVPDSATAIRIAVAVWIPLYGEKLIAGEKPYRATLRGDTWTVTGSIPDGFEGGAAIAELSKRDGRILRVIHEQ
ncbi:MAG TPA: NTF2 fold immunity protein [Polyangia bacterium]|nr:NTF2 fold immunity protein [Polyangia bacterium]